VTLKFTAHSIEQVVAGKKLVTRRTHGMAIVNLTPDTWKLGGYGCDDRGICCASFIHKSTCRFEICKSQYHEGQMFEVGGKIIEITGINPDRVGEISDSDIALEGAKDKNEFIQIWDTIYLAFGHGWAKNPWCWRYQFRVVR
jgi:hypothetical protein